MNQLPLGPHENILSTIGNTPLIRLRRIIPGIRFQVYAKFEALNPGGSIKDRVALNIIKSAMDEGVIQPDTTVIESSSGNLGIGLAQVCAYFGLRFICVVDSKTTPQNIAILRAYGAEIELVSEPDPTTGEFLQARINRVQELRRHLRNSFWCDQYSNPQNPAAHHQTTQEIMRELAGKVDYLFCTTSTCGTLRGSSEYIRKHNLPTKICAVDAKGSVIFDQKPAKRLIPGHGASVKPALYQPDLADRCVHVSDLDCVVGCRLLLRREAILVGGSSGGIISAMAKIQHEIPDDAVCVAILCDRGDRYLDTIYSDSWVSKHLGDVAHLWQT
jgi:2,3-diaminopropionate biosynthesis protein SbnA